jgi:hypothetical protein
MSSGQAGFNNQELIDEQVAKRDLDEFWKRWRASVSENLPLELELLVQRCQDFSTINAAASSSQNKTML